MSAAPSSRIALDWDRAGEAAALVGGMLDGGDRGFGDCRALAFVRGSEVVAGVVYHNWCPEAGVIEISCASRDPRWMSRQAAEVVFGYPFTFCRMVVARTSERNAALLKFWRSIGATVYPPIAGLRGPDEGEVISTLTGDQWARSRWRL